MSSDHWMDKFCRIANFEPMAKIEELNIKIKNLEEETNKKIDQLNKVFNDYSSGVQNVYNEFSKIKDLIDKPHLINNIVRLEDLINQIKSNNEYIEKPEVKEMYEFMRDFQHNIDYFVNKITKIRNMDL